LQTGTVVKNTVGTLKSLENTRTRNVHIKNKI